MHRLRLALLALLLGLVPAHAQWGSPGMLFGTAVVPPSIESPFNGTTRCGSTPAAFFSAIPAINYDCGRQGVAFNVPVISDPACTVGRVNYVKSDFYLGNTTAATSFTTPTFTAIPHGDMIIGTVNSGAATNLASITDNASGNTYHVVPGTPQYDSYGVWNIPFYANNVLNGPTTLTFHYTTPDLGGAGSFDVYSGSVMVAPVSRYLSTSTTTPSTTVTPTASPSTIWGWLNPSSGGTVSAGSGFTLRTNDPPGEFSEDMPTTGTGVKTVSFTNTVAGDNSIMAAALAPAPNPVVTSYRPDYVNIENYLPIVSSIPYDVGCNKVGYWYQYTVNISQSGPYVVNLQAATPSTGVTWTPTIDGQPAGGDIVLANTGSNQIFATNTGASFPDALGKHVLRVTCKVADSNGDCGHLLSVGGAQATGGSGCLPDSNCPTPPTGMVWSLDNNSDFTAAVNPPGWGTVASGTAINGNQIGQCAGGGSQLQLVSGQYTEMHAPPWGSYNPPSGGAVVCEVGMRTQDGASSTTTFGPGYFEYNVEYTNGVWDLPWVVGANNNNCQPLSVGHELDMGEYSSTTGLFYSGYGGCVTHICPDGMDGTTSCNGVQPTFSQSSFSLQGEWWIANGDIHVYQNGTEYWDITGLGGAGDLSTTGGNIPLIFNGCPSSCTGDPGSKGFRIKWFRHYSLVPAGGGPPVPPAAAAAGMSQVLYTGNYSDMAKFGTVNSPGYFNWANGWIGDVSVGGGGTDTTQHEFWKVRAAYPEPGPVPFSNIVPGATDPQTGTKTLKLHWNSSDCTNSCSGQANANSTTISDTSIGGVQCGGAPSWTMPTNFYVQIKWRHDVDPLGTPLSFDTVGWAAYLLDVGCIDAGFNSLEIDPTLWEADGGGSIGFIANWDVHGSCFPGNGDVYCLANGDRSTSTTNAADRPHTDAIMVRNDGLGAGTACSYHDDVLIACNNTFPTTNQATIYRGILVLASGSIAHDHDSYIYEIDIFTRNNCDWRNTECLGPTTP